MTTSGIITGSDGKTLSGISVSVMNNNGSGQILAPGLNDITDSGGNFYIENIPDGTTQAQAFLGIHDPSGAHLDLTQGLVEDEGTLQMDSASTSKIVIPAWAWGLIGVVGLYLLYLGYKKGYFNKLLK